MLKIYSAYFVFILVFVDFLSLSFGWFGAYWLRFHSTLLEVTKGLPNLGSYSALLPLIIILWYVVFSHQGVYLSQRLNRRTEELFLVAKSHFFAGTVFFVLINLVSEYRYSRAVFLIFISLSFFAIIVNRIILRNFLRRIRKEGKNIRYSLIIGESQAAKEVIYRLKHTPELGIKILGMITETGNQLNFHHINEHWLKDVKVLGKYEQILNVLQKHKPDKVFITLKPHEQNLEYVLKQFGTEMCEVHLVPDLSDYVKLNSRIEDFDGIPILNLNSSPITEFSRFFKRWFDIIFSSLVLILGFPIYLLLSLGVKLSSKGPVLYSQVRVGLDGHEFKIFKFRSMPINAESTTGPVWAKKEDNRATKFGSFLRKSNLDELPQFWNVLMGQMSVVGPRPERPIFVDEFKKNIPAYMLRHKVKAGVTGWAQVNGWRGNTSLDKRIEFDLFYIQNWSFALDVKIILLTIFKGFFDKNAY